MFRSQWIIIREFVGASLKSLNFKKSLSLKFLKVNRGDVAA